MFATVFILLQLLALAANIQCYPTGPRMDVCDHFHVASGHPGSIERRDVNVSVILRNEDDQVVHCYDPGQEYKGKGRSLVEICLDA